MGRRRKYVPRTKLKSRISLTSRAQFTRIKLLYPGAVNISGPFKFNKPLIVELVIRPTVFSQAYTVTFSLSGDRSKINVDVVKPLLERRGDQPIPHVYPRNRLCLYQPKYKEWQPHNYIANTIIPWANLWLYYYEEWHRTGIWHGGGEHPDDKR